MDTLFSRIAGLLSQGESCVLAAIFSRLGSAPRAAGARMVIRPDGSSLGTIGGGLLEAAVQRAAPEVFAGHSARVMEFSLSGQDAAQMEMICGGEVSVLLEWLDASQPEETAFWRSLAEVEREGRRAWLVTALPAANQAGGRAVLQERGLSGERNVAVRAVAGAALEAGAAQLGELLQKGAAAKRRSPATLSSGGRHWLVEPLGAAGVLYLFGGGHIAQQLAPLAARVGFRTVVIDDREEFARRERFPQAEQVLPVDSFEGVMQDLPVGEDAYLVIVTRGHLHDKSVLAQALRTPARYIGMIGSRHKRDAVYAALRAEGFDDRDLARVNSPIGLPIGAETPEEIAVSIVAELIACRSGLRHA